MFGTAEPMFNTAERKFNTAEHKFNTAEHRFSIAERRFLLMVATNSPYSFNNFSLFYSYFSLIIFGIVVNNVYFCSYEQITNRFI